MLITTNQQPAVFGGNVPESTSSPFHSLLEPSLNLRGQEVRASIQKQYLIAAERGEISKIRAWRIVRGLDQRALASLANMTQPEVSRAERLAQVGKMKGETLKRLADALRVRVDDLF